MEILPGQIAVKLHFVQGISDSRRLEVTNHLINDGLLTVPACGCSSDGDSDVVHVTRCEHRRAQLHIRNGWRLDHVAVDQTHFEPVQAHLQECGVGRLQIKVFPRRLRRVKSQLASA